eukprot:5566958-Prymnesium_polylepis.1
MEGYERHVNMYRYPPLNNFIIESGMCSIKGDQCAKGWDNTVRKSTNMLEVACRLECGTKVCTHKTHEETMVGKTAAVDGAYLSREKKRYTPGMFISFATVLLTGLSPYPELTEPLPAESAVNKHQNARGDSSTASAPAASAPLAQPDEPAS